MIILSCVIYLIPNFQIYRADNIHFYQTFVMGSMIAIIYKRFKHISLENYKYKASILLITLFIIGARLPFIKFLYITDKPYRAFLYSVLWSTHLVLMIFFHDNNFNIHLKNISFLKTLGTFSFGIYLFHMLGIKFTQYFYSSFQSANEAHLMFTYMFVTFILSYIFHHSIELPSMRMSSYVCKKLHLIKNTQLIV